MTEFSTICRTSLVLKIHNRERGVGLTSAFVLGPILFFLQRGWSVTCDVGAARFKTYRALASNVAWCITIAAHHDSFVCAICFGQKKSQHRELLA